MRRLSQGEYDNAIRDLLGEATRPGRAFPSDTAAIGVAETRNVSPLLFEGYESTARTLVQAAWTRDGLPAMLTATKQRINGETTSIDQVIADKYAGQTRFPSLQVAAPLDSQDCSIDAPTMPIRKGVIQPVICNAQQLFDRVFQESVTPGIDKTTRYRQSVLGAVALRAKNLRQRLGKADQLRMDEYLQPPGALPTDRSAYFKLMVDVSLLALRCDRTRVLAFQSGFGESTWEFDGKKLNQHGDIAHHDNRPENLEYAHRVDLWRVGHFSTLLQQLDAVVEPGGTMLDNSVALFISPGKGRTTGDLFLSILRAFGIERSTFGTWRTKPFAEIA